MIEMGGKTWGDDIMGRERGKATSHLKLEVKSVCGDLRQNSNEG